MQALNQSNNLLKKTASVGCQRGLASMSEAIKERIRCPSMLKKVTYNPEDVTKHIFDGMHMGWSGFTGVGYPKVNHQYNEISWNSERLKIKKKKR